MYNKLNKLSNQELIKSTDNLVKKEASNLNLILFHLIEIEDRKLFLELGYSSLFDYATRGLKYSEPAAYRRIASARCIRDFPEVSEMLLNREVSLTTITLISKIINNQNKIELLKEMTNFSKSQAELLISKYGSGAKQVTERIKPVAKSIKAKSCDESSLELFKVAFSGESKKANDNKDIETEQRFNIQFSIDQETMDKLDKTKKLLSGKYPCGVTLEDLFSLLLKEHIERHCPKKKAQRRAIREERKDKVEVSYKKASGGHTRHIPLALREEVLKRDNYQCSFVSSDGVQCGCKWDLEIEHTVPFSVCKTHELSNLTTFCRAHNLYAAETYFGRDFIQKRSSASGLYSTFSRESDL